MKKVLIVFAALLMLAATGVKAQTTTADATKTAVKKQVQNPAAYACPKCYHITKGAGQCEMCKMDKVQLGTYFCPKCMKGTGAKAGKCPTCNGATVQMTRKYCAKMTASGKMDKDKGMKMKM
ncbi:MAG: hypothetical protein JST86_16755 [Bacteroidetes bacterium]|nr:hypothetical protein [Bacteroidota bacterium]